MEQDLLRGYASPNTALVGSCLATPVDRQNGIKPAYCVAQPTRCFTRRKVDIFQLNHATAHSAHA